MTTLNVRSDKGGFCRSWLIVIVLSGLLSGCDVKLFSELDERNANDILLALNQSGISAQKSQVEVGIWQITVRSDAVQSALAIASRQGLPREQFFSLGDVFAKEGLISTPTEERQRYAFAVSQELSNTLTQIDGVVLARVHPVIPLVDPLDERIPTPSAAVFIKHLHDADLESMVPAIKRLVAQSIEGLVPGNVALTFSAAAPVPINANRLPTETASIEPSSLVISGGLVLAAMIFWPLSRLSLRPSIGSHGSTTAGRRRSVLALIKRWQTDSGTKRKRQSDQNEDDGWNG